MNGKFIGKLVDIENSNNLSKELAKRLLLAKPSSNVDGNPRGSYAAAKPFPHIVIDDFLPNAIAKEAHDCFPAIEDEGWIHYLHFNEKKHGLNKLELLPSHFTSVINALNSSSFVSALSELTGIANLLADPNLEGGGLHQSSTGGFLNIHADFTVHPHQRNWSRRVNLLIYFNENWKEEYRGALELWDRDMKEAVQCILPIFNRCVIFSTDESSYHGFPDPIDCPEGESRKSLALYYFTEEKSPNKKATNYQSRPGDGFKAFWIYLDKKALATYNLLKGKLGISDDFVSKLLRILNRKK